jgi:hypothetical protein
VHIGILLGIAIALSGPAVQVQRPVPRLNTSRAFQRALSEKVTAGFVDAPLRRGLAGISAKWKVAILVDRRVDPTRKVTLSLKEASLKDAIAAIAKTASARTAIVGNTIYIGPAPAVAALEDVIEKRAAEWRKAAKKWPRARRRALLAHPTLHWNDLDRPRDLVKDFAAKFGLTVDGLDKVPHDLWAGATLPGCSVSQGLSLLLVQFDLTFHWRRDGSGIEIVPQMAPKKTTRVIRPTLPQPEPVPTR